MLALTVGPLLALRCAPPPTTAFMLRTLATPDCDAIDFAWAAWDEIAPAAKVAVVAAEDQRFADHRGFDFVSIRAAARDRLRGGPTRGASTLTQQVAKNLFLWPGRSFVRKGVEAWIAAWIEVLWPKRRILEVYLNVAQLGPCTFGVEAASRRAFGKPARHLSLREAALLAAVLPDPVGRRIEAPSPSVQRRAGRIAAEVRRLGGTGWLARLERGAR